MKNLKYCFIEAVNLFGGLFLILIVSSFFFPTFEMVEKQKVYLIFFFVVFTLGKYLLYRHKQKIALIIVPIIQILNN